MRISIITVSFNSEQTIERTIKSVVNQNYDDIEYILIDGGSSDRTVDIIKKYEKYISYWISEKDEGIYDAMNKGLRHSTGEIVAFLNSDDWYEENIFTDVASIFGDERIQLLCGDMYIHREGTVTRHHINEDVAQKVVRYSMGYTHPTMFARKKLFDKYGEFDIQYKIAADYDWFLKVFDHNEKIKVIDKVLTNFSYGGVSTKEEKMPCLLVEQRQIALRALERNAILTENRKSKWKEVIEWEIDNMQYNFKIQQIIDHAILDKNELALKLAREIFREEHYIVFGSGNVAMQLIGILQKIGVCITAIWDNNARRWGKSINGIGIMKPDKMKVNRNAVIVASIYYENEIGMQLISYGYVKNTHYFLYRELRNRLVDKIEQMGAILDVKWM